VHELAERVLIPRPQRGDEVCVRPLHEVDPTAQRT
jgi:hypothetical protein